MRVCVDFCLFVASDGGGGSGYSGVFYILSLFIYLFIYLSIYLFNYFDRGVIKRFIRSSCFILISLNRYMSKKS